MELIGRLGGRTSNMLAYLNREAPGDWSFVDRCGYLEYFRPSTGEILGTAVPEYPEFNLYKITIKKGEKNESKR
jgi:hypothetical protein